MLKQNQRAVFISFTANGIMYASLISRVPALGAELGLSTGELGLLLVWLSAGAISGLPLAGHLVEMLGSRGGILAGICAVSVGLMTLAAATSLGAPVLAGVGLYATGFGMGVWEVSMNVAGAAIANGLKSNGLLPRLHAALSLGTVVGALSGAGLSRTSTSLSTQTLLTAVVLPVVGLIVARMLRALEGSGSSAVPEDDSPVRPAWREPRTLLIGFMVLGFAFAEGAANEWLAYTLVDGYAASPEAGALAFALFLAAMTVGRVTGGILVSRYGRVRILRLSTVIALVGVGVVALGESAWLAAAAALAWGFGVALGFPLGMAAASDEPSRAASRVAAVSSIGYTAFLAGPPLLGLLGSRFGIQQALLVVSVPILVAMAVAGAAKPVTLNQLSHE